MPCFCSTKERKPTFRKWTSQIQYCSPTKGNALTILGYISFNMCFGPERQAWRTYKKEGAQKFLFEYSPQGTFLLSVYTNGSSWRLFALKWWKVCNSPLPQPQRHLPSCLPPSVGAPNLILLYSLILEMKEQWIWLINQPPQGRAIREVSGCVPTGNKQARGNLRVRNLIPKRTPEVM